MASSSWGSQLELDNLASLMGDHVVELDYEEDGESDVGFGCVFGLWNLL